MTGGDRLRPGLKYLGRLVICQAVRHGHSVLSVYHGPSTMFLLCGHAGTGSGQKELFEASSVVAAKASGSHKAVYRTRAVLRRGTTCSVIK